MITVRDVLIVTLLVAAVLTLAYLCDAYEPALEGGGGCNGLVSINNRCGALA